MFSTSRELPPQPEQWQTFLVSDYLRTIRALAAEATLSTDYHDDETGNISTEAWKRLVEGGLLQAVLEYRDVNKKQEEIMQIARMLSYYDIHLGLSFGILGALGIMTIQAFAQSEVQRQQLLDMIEKGGMIALGITELKSSGSAALNMHSSYVIDEDSGTVKLAFAKHLQGLSGKQGMIVAALKANTSKKTIGLFFVPQELILTSITPMVALAGIPYGINEGDIEFSAEEHLIVELPQARFRDFQAMFTQSRLLFVGMTLGEIERMEIEAKEYARARMIGDVRQEELQSVQHDLQVIQARRQISEAIFHTVVSYRNEKGESLLMSGVDDLIPQANMVKTLSTHYAILAAEKRAELRGGSSFYAGNAMQAVVDIKPFATFEGAEKMLHIQIADALLGQIKTENGKVPGFLQGNYQNLFRFVEVVCDHRRLFARENFVENLNDMTRFMLELVKPATYSEYGKEILGQVFSRIFALGCIHRQAYAETDYTHMIELLNLELVQLLHEFFSSEGKSQWMFEQMRRRTTS